MSAKLNRLENAAISGYWLLGSSSEDLIISRETYTWVWQNLCNICESPRLIKVFWNYSSHYFNDRFRYKRQFDFRDKTLDQLYNKNDFTKDEFESFKLQELYFALGGLMLYKNQIQSIKYFFEYTESIPPVYPLLPQSMTPIFNWFAYFSSDYFQNPPIEYIYPFPELEHLGNSHKIKFWICCYFVVLFIRQFKLTEYYVDESYTSLPDLPNDLIMLRNMKDSIAYFEKCFNYVISKKIFSLNNDLDLEFDEVKCKSFLSNLKSELNSRADNIQSEGDLSLTKCDQFYKSASEIISNSFDSYKLLFTDVNEYYKQSKLKLSIDGGITLMSRSAFIEGDIPYLNFDSAFAEAIVINKIKRYVPNSFLIAKTKRYLIRREKFEEVLNRMIGKNDDAVIVAVSPNYQTKVELAKLSGFSSKIISIESSDYNFSDTLYVLNESDLPAIEYLDIENNLIDDYELKIISNTYKLFASIIDIDNAKYLDLRGKLKIETDPENCRVLLSIFFRSVIYWKNDREVIQINFVSDFIEQGVPNDVKDIAPLYKKRLL